MEFIRDERICPEDLEVFAPRPGRLKGRLIAIGERDVRQEWILSKLQIKFSCDLSTIGRECGQGGILDHPRIERARLAPAKPADPFHLQLKGRGSKMFQSIRNRMRNLTIDFAVETQRDVKMLAPAPARAVNIDGQGAQAFSNRIGNRKGGEQAMHAENQMGEKRAAKSKKPDQRPGS
nr:hypothetical protein [Hyphomonas sp. Mor2]